MSGVVHRPYRADEERDKATTDPWWSHYPACRRGGYAVIMVAVTEDPDRLTCKACGRMGKGPRG